MQRVVAILTIAALPAIAVASGSPGDHYHDRAIHQASALVPWCRSEAEARYIAKNIVPYQWTASYHDRGNVLYVEGELRVHGDDVAGSATQVGQLRR